MRTMLLLALLGAGGCVPSATYGQPPGGYYQRSYIPVLPPAPRFQVIPARVPVLR
jgi:hypothetical protein